MDGRTFFAELGRLVAEHPPPDEHRPALEAARRLGLLGPLDARIRAAADEGVARALAAVDAAAGELVEEREGRWRVRHPHAPAGTDYRRPAATARAGLAETPPAEELCASARTDDQGCSLSGRHRYLLRFPPDALPPAQAFWSLSARATGNPGTRRYAVGNPDGLLLERDGSLPIHIQCDPPGSLRAPNWLPTPPGAFDVVLRLFWPTDDALQRRWSPPAVTRVG